MGFFTRVKSAIVGVFDKIGSLFGGNDDKDSSVVGSPLDAGDYEDIIDNPLIEDEPEDYYTNPDDYDYVDNDDYGNDGDDSDFNPFSYDSEWFAPSDDYDDGTKQYLDARYQIFMNNGDIIEGRIAFYGEIENLNGAIIAKESDIDSDQITEIMYQLND